MSEDTQFIEDDKTSALDDTETPEADDQDVNGIVAHVKKSFARAESMRRTDEDRWLQAYRNYRGIYGPAVVFSEAEKSRVFIKVTKTKVLAAYQQIADVLFSGNKFPLTVDRTTLPEDVAEAVTFDPQNPNPTPENESPEPQSPYGFAGDGNDLEPGATRKSVMDRLGGMTDKLKNMVGLSEGEGKSATSQTIHPAEISAKKMEKKIHDQLEESSASKHLRSTAFECPLFGSGVMKGPFAEDKEYPKWDEGGQYTPVFKTMPKTEHVSIWDSYPDPDTKTVEDGTFFIQRHKLSRSGLRKLNRRPYFRSEVIEKVIDLGESYTKKHWEDSLRDYTNSMDTERFEVLEYWGFIDKEVAQINNLKIPEEFKDNKEIQVNVWTCGNHILRFVINPFKPQRIPYYIVPYEHNPYSIFGVGVAENMDDTQQLMNGFMRMAVDNGVLSGNLLIEIDETNLVPGQDLDVHPGKVFRRQGGAPGQAIFGTKYPNVSNENMQMFDKARQLADDATGLPSFSHGQTGVSGTGRTAAGISMLMNAAAGSVKSVVKNFDDYLIRPLGEAFFAFNMQFDHDPEIKGDLEVKARGTDSLMQNEVRSQRLMSFMQVASNPVLAPFAKFSYIMKEIAKSLGLDPDKVTNSPEEAAAQAAMMPQNNPMMGHNGGPPMDPLDMTGVGGGNIGVGAAPVPGEEQFSGNMNVAPEGISQPSQAAGNQPQPV